MTTGLFVQGGSNDQWNGLALGDLDMNGFSITNINTLDLTQTDTTGCGASFYRNLAAADTDSAIVCIHNDNAGDDQRALTIQQDGTGEGLFIDQNGANNALEIDQDGAAEAIYSNNLNSGTWNTFIRQSGFLFCQFSNDAVSHGAAFFYRNYTAADTASPVVLIENDHDGDDQAVLKIENDGTGAGIEINSKLATSGIALDIDQDGDSYGINVLSAATTNTQYGIRIVTGAGATVANFEYAGTEFARFGIHNSAEGSNWFYRNLAAADTAGAVVFIEQDNATDDQIALKIQQDGVKEAIFIDQNGNDEAIYIDHDDTGSTASLVIDRDGNSAARLFAIGLYCDNAGAGDNGGIDMTSFTSCEPLLGVPVDTCTPTANYGAFTVYVNGVGNKLVKLFNAIE